MIPYCSIHILYHSLIPPPLNTKYINLFYYNLIIIIKLDLWNHQFIWPQVYYFIIELVDQLWISMDWMFYFSFLSIPTSFSFHFHNCHSMNMIWYLPTLHQLHPCSLISFPYSPDTSTTSFQHSPPFPLSTLHCQLILSFCNQYYHLNHYLSISIITNCNIHQQLNLHYFHNQILILLLI